MTEELIRICIRRLHLIPTEHSGDDSSQAKSIILAAEMIKLGFLPADISSWNDSVHDNYHVIIDELQKLKGADVEYVPLFTGFPEKVPDQDEYFIERLIGYLGTWIGIFNEAHHGRELFNLEEFGADPITQKQTESLYKQALANQHARKTEDNTENLILITSAVIDEAYSKLHEYMSNLLYARTSIKEALKDDIMWYVEKYHKQIHPEKIVFKETMTMLASFQWNNGNYDKAMSFTRTPTDVLRILAAVTGSDVSLAKPIKFPRLQRPMRRAILWKLDKMGSSNAIAEDIVPYRDLWLKIGEFLHPMDPRNKRFANISTAFNKIRNTKVRTFNGLVETAIKNGEVGEAVRLLETRPTLFIRRLGHLLRVFKSNTVANIIMNRMLHVGSQVPFKVLLTAYRYLEGSNRTRYHTTINKRGTLSVNKWVGRKPNVYSPVIPAIWKLTCNAAKKQAWKRIYIAPECKGIVLPAQERKASEGLMDLPRGTYINMQQDKPVLRLFLYWKDRDQVTDLDLSLIIYDDAFEKLAYISYTNLTDIKAIMVHSGDLQSAPEGAAEFIDINLPKLAEVYPTAKFAVPTIFHYVGSQFDELDTVYTGWMYREEPNSNYKSFDPATVVNKINVRGNKASEYLPFAVEIGDNGVNHLINIDMYVAGLTRFNRVEEASDNIALIVTAMSDFRQSRPTMNDLAIAIAIGNNISISATREDAEVTFGLEDTDTYSPYDISKLLTLM